MHAISFVGGFLFALLDVLPFSLRSTLSSVSYEKRWRERREKRVTESLFLAQLVVSLSGGGRGVTVGRKQQTTAYTHTETESERKSRSWRNRRSQREWECDHRQSQRLVVGSRSHFPSRPESRDPFVCVFGCTFSHVCQNDCCS